MNYLNLTVIATLAVIYLAINAKVHEIDVLKLTFDQAVWILLVVIMCYQSYQSYNGKNQENYTDLPTQDSLMSKDATDTYTVTPLNYSKLNNVTFVGSKPFNIISHTGPFATVIHYQSPYNGGVDVLGLDGTVISSGILMAGSINNVSYDGNGNVTVVAPEQ